MIELVSENCALERTLPPSLANKQLLSKTITPSSAGLLFTAAHLNTLKTSAKQFSCYIHLIALQEQFLTNLFG